MTPRRLQPSRKETVTTLFDMQARHAPLPFHTFQGKLLPILIILIPQIKAGALPVASAASHHLRLSAWTRAFE